MKRLKNYYCWYTVKDWLDALAQGYVGRQKQEEGGKEEHWEHSIKKLLEMAENDCIPAVIQCMRGTEGYYVEYDRLLYRFFDFLTNKASLLADGKSLFFTDLDFPRRTRILNAQIHSVWIDIT